MGMMGEDNGMVDSPFDPGVIRKDPGASRDGTPSGGSLRTAARYIPTTVLLISSDGVLLRCLDDCVSSCGSRTVCCRETAQSLEVYFKSRPGLIVADIGNAGLTFSAAAQVLHRIDYAVPMLLVTEAEDREFAIQTVEEGAYDFVEKPVDARRFQAGLRRAMELSDHLSFRRNHQLLLEERVHEKTVEISRGKDFLQAILDSSTLVSIVLTDLDQNVLFWNTGAERMFGYSREEMVGRKITQLYPADEDTEKTVSRLRRKVMGKEGIAYGKMRQLTKDGRILYVSLALTPLVDRSGGVEGTVGVGLDLTEMVRLNDQLEDSLRKIHRIQEVAIFMLAKVAESRDKETGSHLMRIREYGRALCSRLSETDGYSNYVTSEFVDHLVRSSVLHDIGKVAIPDSILLSSEPFGPDERRIMMQHCIYGGDALDRAVKALGEESFLSMGREIAYYHHEHWDGRGYPAGLRGEEIPLSARIVAIADVYDALTTRRRYKKQYSHEEACAAIVKNRGTQFDPQLVDIFIEVQSEFMAIRNSLSDRAGREGSIQEV